MKLELIYGGPVKKMAAAADRTDTAERPSMTPAVIQLMLIGT